MTDIRQRLEKFRSRLDEARLMPGRARDETRHRRHLTLLREQCDALHQILDELGPALAGSREWPVIHGEFDVALKRLERSLGRALTRQAAYRERRDEWTAQGRDEGRGAVI
jgi:hypothetical protein